MRVWETRIQVFRPIQELPIPLIVVEEVQDNPLYGFKGKNRKGDLACQLVCTLEGEGAFFDGKRTYRLLPGKAFMARHCDSKTAYFYPPHGHGKWRFIWVAFQGKTALEMLHGITKRYGYVFELALDKGIIKKLLSFKNYSAPFVTFSPLSGAEFVMEILGSAELANFATKDSFKDSVFLDNARRLIIENLYSKIKIKNLASRLGLSREHFSRIFREQSGISPGEYIIREKMRAACLMIKEDALTCKEISDRLGYDNPASFTRAFKAVTKTTTRQFKKIGQLPSSF
jgi:AraC-like DNA-binding protein